MAESRLRRTRAAYQTNQAARAWDRRVISDFPFRTRWAIVRHRWMVSQSIMLTCRCWWVDLLYLLRG